MIDLPEDFIEEFHHIDELRVAVGEPRRAHVTCEHIRTGGHYQRLQRDNGILVHHPGKFREELAYLVKTDLVQSVIVGGSEPGGTVESRNAPPGLLQLGPVA